MRIYVKLEWYEDGDSYYVHEYKGVFHDKKDINLDGLPLIDSKDIIIYREGYFENKNGNIRGIEIREEIIELLYFKK